MRRRSGQQFGVSSIGFAALCLLATLLGFPRPTCAQFPSGNVEGKASDGSSLQPLPDTLQAGITKPNYTQLFTGEMTGAAPVESDSAFSRFSITGESHMFRNPSGQWRHGLEFGTGLEESLATEERRVFEGLNLFLFPAKVPSMVEEFNSPSHAMQRLRELSFYAEDRMDVAKRIFVRLGASLDLSAACLPRQTSGVGPYAPARQFGGVDNVVSWTSFSPRLGLAIPLWKDFGGARITAVYAR